LVSSFAPEEFTKTILEGGNRRRQAPNEGQEAVVLPDDLLPGVGAQPMSLRQGIEAGGLATVVLLGLASFVQMLDQSGFAILAPDIQKTFDVSTTVITVIGSGYGFLFLLGSLPISSLADRHPRTRIAALCIAGWSVVMVCTAFVQNAFGLFVARLGSGLGQSYAVPVNGPLLVDTYPIGARGKVFSVAFGFQMAALAVAPLAIGALASLFSPATGWRWVFVIIGVVALPIAFAISRLREPPRGQHEMLEILGEAVEPGVSAWPISLGVAFARLRKIKSFHFFLLGMAALGFALFTVPIYLNIILLHVFHLDVWHRGIIGAVDVLPGLIMVGFIGRGSDRLFRRSPPLAMILVGTMVGAFGVCIAIAMFMPNLPLFVLFLALGISLANCSFAVLPATLSATIPYRLRSRGFAMIGVYIFLFGSFLGAIITGLLAKSLGDQHAVAAVVLPAGLLGGLFMTYGARYVRRDISLVVEELQEEQEQHRQTTVAEAASVPVLQVRNLDFSYGRVQVLFDINFDVGRGEVLAVLGTNGAGKSTLLRVISGLGVAERGVVRLNGRLMTYADPELRVKIGVVQLRGGAGTFPNLTVDQNLRIACYLYRSWEMGARIDHVLDIFPELQSLRPSPAENLSGGEQQMLAFAMCLMHDPEILIIDEMSLGLAPAIVDRLLDVLTRLREKGLTMIVVEQSLNIACTMADRVIFMDKGSVRFEGSVAELIGRDDLARAVFLAIEQPE
jgi:ABC-type branched-subunit amino acid transport system ATPase component/predicted MFS family arabinose efflux permease